MEINHNSCLLWQLDFHIRNAIHLNKVSFCHTLRKQCACVTVRSVTFKRHHLHVHDKLQWSSHNLFSHGHMSLWLAGVSSTKQSFARKMWPIFQEKQVMTKPIMVKGLSCSDLYSSQKRHLKEFLYSKWREDGYSNIQFLFSSNF